MVVPVLMISCYVSEKWKNGPLTAQAKMTTKQIAKALGRPDARATADANAVNALLNAMQDRPGRALCCPAHPCPG